MMGVLAPFTVDTIMEIQAPTKMTRPNSSGFGVSTGIPCVNGVDDTSSDFGAAGVENSPPTEFDGGGESQRRVVP